MRKTGIVLKKIDFFPSYLSFIFKICIYDLGSSVYPAACTLGMRESCEFQLMVLDCWPSASWRQCQPSSGKDFSHNGICSHCCFLPQPSKDVTLNWKRE